MAAKSGSAWKKANLARAKAASKKPGGIKLGPPRPGHKPYEDEPGWKANGRQGRKLGDAPKRRTQLPNGRTTAH